MFQYREAIGWPPPKLFGGDIQPQYNRGPGSAPVLLHRLGADRHEAADYVHWGYRPPAAVEKQIPMAIRIRLDRAIDATYFRHMWRSGRAICPVDGWYEWVEEGGKNLPWYVRAKVDAPLFLAAVTNWKPYRKVLVGTGFVLITAREGGGIVDVRERRPIVLSAPHAKLWMDPDLPPGQAEILAREKAIGPDYLEWYRVSTMVDDPKANDPRMVNPVAPAQETGDT